jgi:hypothetical protein
MGPGSLNPRELAEAERQSRLLADVDVLVLNEVDDGLSRTGYRNVAADLATAL